MTVLPVRRSAAAASVNQKCVNVLRASYYVEPNCWALESYLVPLLLSSEFPSSPRARWKWRRRRRNSTVPFFVFPRHPQKRKRTNKTPNSDKNHLIADNYALIAPFLRIIVSALQNECWWDCLSCPISTAAARPLTHFRPFLSKLFWIRISGSHFLTNIFQFRPRAENGPLLLLYFAD